MADRVTRETRHRIMSSNRGRDTGPELEVRRALFACGFRYRLHGSGLPGKPDLVFPKHRAVIFVNGCYWHGHDCRRKPRSKSNQEYRQAKIKANRERDIEVREELLAAGWRILVVWECAVRRRDPPFAASAAFDHVVSWLHGTGELGILSENEFEEHLCYRPGRHP